jgi:hypothetical protein
LKCPICDVNEELYQAGEKDAASKFRASRSFFMNVIDRSNPGQGVLKYAPGTTVFQAIASAISDPDYGDISDVNEGYDLKIERTGEGRENTKYQTRPVKRSTPLGDEAQIAEWLAAATDLKQFVHDQLMDYDELAKKSGVDVYFSSDDDEEAEPVAKKAAPKAAAPAPKVAAPKPAARRAPEPDEEDEEEPPVAKSASAAIGERISDRERRAKLLRR